MSHTYVSNLIHIVFSTSERRDLISEEMRERLWAFMGGVARERNAKALAIGGTGNHVHILLSVPATIHIADLVKAIKAISSIWIHDNFPDRRLFAWQKGLWRVQHRESATRANVGLHCKPGGTP
jgi:putative transposase